ncbi:SIS domain-containing protein [Enterovibrio coralii]|uniref:Tagatose-6-phosphate ketose isomerase n=1 Tax=Enterovibrio coralii TaxID=294935 RepID=A0A135I4L6_9GAMM|nr:SIS domain-containing protein [Enterovibrio coralii]KXF80367.1 tagatose-6-phosphate ketose isomerase [Enterovibrio coralii]
MPAIASEKNDRGRHHELPSYSAEWLAQHGAEYTATEIAQQPNLWRQLAVVLANRDANDNAFLAPIFAQSTLRVLLTGAGTSAYAGDALAPWLRTQGMDARAVATTDIVSNPTEYLDANVPTLLVSFARSGNSPESVAAVTIADQVVNNLWHLILTCNEQGELYRYALTHDNALCHLMPEGSNDKSFAMTSSFTCMTLAAMALIGRIPRDTFSQRVDSIATVVETGMTEWTHTANSLADKDYQRLVILGSGGLAGVARESSLKSLELSAGQVATTFESSLGFRHGPKFMIDEQTLVIQFISSDSYTQQYDIDMYREIHANSQAMHQLALTVGNPAGLDGDVVSVSDTAFSDVWLTFPYVVFAQMLAMSKSLQLGYSPDNPCPTGEVNRVVQGVTIYPFSHH